MTKCSHLHFILEEINRQDMNYIYCYYCQQVFFMKKIKNDLPNLIFDEFDNVDY